MPRAKRRLGQHFLTDPRILQRIADALGATAADTVLEIGPGPGGLTEVLAARAGRLIAIEKDADLVPALRARVPDATVVEADALEADWHALAGPDGLVAGNIPYNITSPLIDKALAPPRPARIVFLVQKEVADRVGAAPGGEAYGALSVGVQAVARAERLFIGARRRVSSPAQGGLRGAAADAAGGAHRERTRKWSRSAGSWWACSDSAASSWAEDCGSSPGGTRSGWGRRSPWPG